MPKLLIHGANDRYWATDATRQYWDDLPGEKHLLTVPNSGHGLEDRARVLDSMAAFFHGVAKGHRLPRLTARESRNNGKIVVHVRASEQPEEVRLWTARAPDLDFRPAKWEMTPMQAEGSEFRVEVSAPASGGLALFTEGAFRVDGDAFTLSTPPAVFGNRPGAVQ
jgi:PhoPQ-activated pathogenicity-related protein